MAITFYWGSGSPDSWRILLALEHKGLPYESHLLHFDKQEHQSPPMLKMNPRGRLPVLKDGDYVVFESVAVLYYLDVKYPAIPIFGLTPEEAGVIMRVICEFQTYAEPALSRIVNAIFEGGVADAFEELTDPVEQRARFIADRARRVALGGETWPMDEEFLAALPHVPPCAGIALGFDRLAMLASDANDIGQVLWLPGTADPIYR